MEAVIRFWLMLDSRCLGGYSCWGSWRVHAKLLAQSDPIVRATHESEIVPLRYVVVIK